ncbi:MAG TPA: hypothetical protein VMZ29_00235 [Candidatus Bathyarchaeia archaeon]|nr:hypothetical protein [Candidatus Bathyarchaeia archaeon]
MSCEDICKEKCLAFMANNELTKEFNRLFQEYNRIKIAYEETNDALKMKLKAFEFLEKCSPNYEKAITSMKLAVKIIKSCNGLRR